MRGPGRFPRNFPEKNRPGAGAAVDPSPSRNRAHVAVGRAGPISNPRGAASPIGGPGAKGRPISWAARLEVQSLRNAAEALIRFNPILPANLFTP